MIEVWHTNINILIFIIKDHSESKNNIEDITPKK